jgi:tyrosine decarboxylase/aspartate 1-decarboxylase
MIDAELFSILREQTKNDAWVRNLTIMNMSHDYPSIAIKLYTEFLETDMGQLHEFQGLLKLEREAIHMLVDFFGDPSATGDVTSGGTEGNILAMRAAKKLHPKTKPNMIAPVTAHPSFDKGAELMGIELRRVPVNHESWIVDPKAMEEKIDENTVGLIASCGTAGEGVIDPIPEVAKIAKRHDVCLHVDAAWGGFICPFWKELGMSGIPDFDFGLDGVTTISADPHKMLAVPMSCGGIFFKTQEIREKVVFNLNMGGVKYTNPGIIGSRSGAPSVALWGVIKSLGYKGFLETARITLRVTQELIDGVKSIPGLGILVDPKINLVAITTKLPVNKVYSAMWNRGWKMYALTEDPSCFRLIPMPQVAPSVGRFLDDLRNVVKEMS